MRKLILATLATVALGSAALAQSRTYQPPVQIFPAPKQQQGLAGPPRTDFQGAKQAVNPSGKAKKSTSKSTSKRHAQHMHGKQHHAS
jgi:hypothetical protein